MVCVCVRVSESVCVMCWCVVGVWLCVGAVGGVYVVVCGCDGVCGVLDVGLCVLREDVRV